MSKEYKSDCGCIIRLIKWSAKANVLSMKQCPLHKTAQDLLTVAKEARLQIEYLREKFQETGSGNMILARLMSAIKRAEEAQ